VTCYFVVESVSANVDLPLVEGIIFDPVCGVLLTGIGFELGAFKDGSFPDGNRLLQYRNLIIASRVT